VWQRGRAAAISPRRPADEPDVGRPPSSCRAGPHALARGQPGELLFLRPARAAEGRRAGEVVIVSMVRPSRGARSQVHPPGVGEDAGPSPSIRHSGTDCCPPLQYSATTGGSALPLCPSRPRN